MNLLIFLTGVIFGVGLTVAGVALLAGNATKRLKGKK